MLAEIEQETVDFGPNYDDSLTEPRPPSARIPNLLVNGSSGIAVGMATNIPPHNLRRSWTRSSCCSTTPRSIDGRPDDGPPGPDFPTAGFIHGVDGIRKAYETGRGIVQMRARVEIETDKHDRETIVVTELPYQVNKAALLEKIAELVRDKKITGIGDLRDESGPRGDAGRHRGQARGGRLVHPEPALQAHGPPVDVRRDPSGAGRQPAAPPHAQGTSSASSSGTATRSSSGGRRSPPGRRRRGRTFWRGSGSRSTTWTL